MVTLRAPEVLGLKQAPSLQGKERQAENSAFGERAQQGVQDPSSRLGIQDQTTSQQGGGHRCRTRTEAETPALCCADYSGNKW